jgi:trigger factor
MKTELVDVSETRRNLVVEIPSDVVDREIDKVTARYGKSARLPGFRPGRVPSKVVRQRFRGQILQDAAEHLIGHAVQDALTERGVEPLETPDIRDLKVEEGRPLTFTASFDVVPSFDPGDGRDIEVRRPPRDPRRSKAAWWRPVIRSSSISSGAAPTGPASRAPRRSTTR